MGSITIPDLEDDLKERLRIRAARYGHSMEEEARLILRRALEGMTGAGLLTLTERLFGEEHGVELAQPPRGDEREGPHFEP